MLVLVVSFAFTISLSLHLTSSHFVTTGDSMLQVLRPLWDAVSRSKLHGPRWPKVALKIHAALNITEPRSAHFSSFLALDKWHQAPGITFVIREITIDKVGSTSSVKTQLCR